MLEEKEGLLVEVAGKVTRIEGQNIYVNDGTGEARVYTEGYIGSSANPGVADEWKSRIKVGDKVSAIGLASEDPEGHRLRVRDSAEIVVLEDDEENQKPEEPDVDVKPEEPGVDVKPEGGNGSENGSGSNNGSGTNNGSNNNGTTNLPNTGGVNSTIYVVVAIIVVAAGAIVLFKKKGKK